MICGLPNIELFASGHRACAGCGPALVMRHALKATGKDIIVVQATGCMEVASTPYPETSWRVPWIHVAFENAASVASGVHRALTHLKKRDKVHVLVIGGDGGTFDIGLQFISGAFERRENICYICYDNEAYMNTGIQRSGATPKYANTTTSPAGKKIHGKTENRKDMPFIMAAHGVYVATANIAFPQDFVEKVKKGLNGPSYIQVLSPCPTGWYFPNNLTIDMAKKAHNSKVAPLFEIENGVLKMKKPTKIIPVEDYLMLQGRFKHLSKDEIKEVQKHVDSEYERLEKIEASGLKVF